MNKPTFLIHLLFSVLFSVSFGVSADDTDIFLNPNSGTGSSNILVVVDSAGSVNAQTTDIDGVQKKIYTVAGNVIKALLAPATLKVKRTVFPATSIVTSGANCTPPTTGSPVGVTTSCTCESFDWVTDTSDSTLCKLKPERVEYFSKLINGINLGVMLYNGSNSSGANGAAQKGGYVAYNVQSMAIADTVTFIPAAGENRKELIDKLASVPTGNGSMYAMSMYESYLYFKNLQAENGFDGSDNFLTTSLQGYDRRACNKNNPAQNCSGVAYKGPVVANSCNNAIVVIGPGSPDNSALERDTSYLSGVGGASAATVLATGVTPNYDSNMFDEWAKYLNSIDINPNSDGVQSLQTYTIMNDPAPDARAVAFMKNAGVVGGGGYYEAKNAIDFLEAFAAILDKVQSVNSAFASVALPVSVNVRGTNLNQVYVGMFRPDANGRPRWYGNMKEYQLAYDSATNDVFLADKNGIRAETSSGQLISDAATSFWTTSSSFWAFAPSGTPKTGNDAPDGSVVEKGGAAQRARSQFATSQSTRNLYTCINCANGTNLTSDVGTKFVDANTSVLKDIAGRSDLINWCRGQDLENENNTALSANALTTDVRASLYGDVLHSRPAVINYNRNTTCSLRDDNDVYLFYGANDGFLKATKGGGDTTGNGNEAWGFIPGEFVKYDIASGDLGGAKLQMLYSNNPANPKPYFVDGSISSYIEYTTQTCSGAASIQKVSKAYILATMRRGGPYLYVLDVTDPLVPKVKWRISKAVDGFSELGDTWSEAKVQKVNVKGVVRPVVIFGGGYDAAVEDINNTSITAADTSGVTTALGATSRTQGRAVYIVDLETGALIWRASNTTASCPSGSTTLTPTTTTITATCVVANGMDYAIPSDITIVDRDYDGTADRLYFGDTGGNVWRATIADSNPQNWVAYRLAQMNATRGTETAVSARRKFLYPPDVVAGPGYDLVLIGSGDREHPFDVSVTNRFYAIKDNGSVPSVPINDADVSLKVVTSSNITTGGVTLDTGDSGWLYTLANSGEKVVSAPVSLNAITYFNTNIPRSGCSSGLGEARIYALNYLTGAASLYHDGAGNLSAFTSVSGGGYLPTGVPAVVDVGGKLREVLLVGTKVSQDIGVVELGRRVRTYWFQQIDQ